MKQTATKEFLAFLKEYKVVSLAIAFVMGTATDAVVKSLVNNIIMPLVEPLIVADRWQEAMWSFGPFSIGIGAFAADALRFFVLAVIIFFVVKKMMRIDYSSK